MAVPLRSHFIHEETEAKKKKKSTLGQLGVSAG